MHSYLDGLDGRVYFVSLDNGFDDIKSVLNVLVVDRGIPPLILIKGPDPSCVTNGPVLEGLFLHVFAVEGSRPLETHGLSRIVETVLAVFHCVDVQQDGHAIGPGPG